MKYFASISSMVDYYQGIAFNRRMMNVLVEDAKRRSKMSELSFYVAGVQHHNIKHVIDELETGDELDLVPEPTNQYDPNAVAVQYEGVMIGYVPKKHSAEVSAWLELGDDLICEITTLKPHENPWAQLKVTIHNHSDSDDEEDLYA